MTRPMIRAALALCAVVLLPPVVVAQEPLGPRVSIELNATETIDGACQMSFLVQNGHEADIASAVYEAVLFDADGRVERLTLFDFGALPAARPRVRQFVVGGLDCAGLSRLLINGAETCTGDGLPVGACVDGLRLTTRTQTEILGVTALGEALARIYALGGPVVAILGALSVLVLATVFYKLWQFAQEGVGRHRALREAVALWDAGDRSGARATLGRSRSYLRPVIEMALDDRADTARLDAEAEARFARLEGGFRLLDTVAQLAPLLGLFGTVLGMISAFQALQDAGAQVDPSILAGGIWVALTTTAAGLAVAMPTALILSWFEARMDAERVLAQGALRTIRSPARGPAQGLAGRSDAKTQTRSAPTTDQHPGHA